MQPSLYAVLDTLNAEMRRQWYYARRGLDATADAEDVAQTMALAQLEAPEGEARKLARRMLWPVRRARGATHRSAWSDAVEARATDDAAGSDLAAALLQTDLEKIVGAEMASLVWHWAVAGWSLSDLGAERGLTKQQLWHQLRPALRTLKAAFSEAAPKQQARRPRKLLAAPVVIECAPVPVATPAPEPSVDTGLTDFAAWVARKEQLRARRAELHDLVGDAAVYDATWHVGPCADKFDLADEWDVPPEIAAARVNVFAWEHPECYAQANG